MLTIFVAVVASFAQSWRTYAPTSESFSVELPTSLCRVGAFEGKYGVVDEPDVHRYKHVSFYASIQSEAKREYGIIVINRKAEKSVKGQKADDIEGFEVFIGSDEATPTSETIIRANGLVGKEYTYAKEIKVGIFTRGRVFGTPTQIYVLVFRARTAKDLNSPDAERFLGSFRLK